MTTNTKHTPGPWRVLLGQPTLVEGPPREKWAPLVICNVGGTKPQDKANAHVIAAAPEMLEALRSIVKRHDARADEVESGFTCGCPDCVDAITAIAKAEGK